MTTIGNVKLKSLPYRQLLIAFLPAAAILLIIAGVSTIVRVEVSEFTRDLASLAEIHPLSGFLSNLEVLVWCATASICLFSAIFLRKAMPEVFGFLLSSGLLSLYLLFDDFFLFHEDLASRYLNLDENVIFALLGFVLLVYLAVFKRVILSTRFMVLFLSLGLFALSIAIDFIHTTGVESFDSWKTFFEDGAKWLGIVSWCSYYVHTSYLFLANSFAVRRRGDISASPM